MEKLLRGRFKGSRKALIRKAIDLYWLWSKEESKRSAQALQIDLLNQEVSRLNNQLARFGGVATNSRTGLLEIKLTLDPRPPVKANANFL